MLKENYINILNEYQNSSESVEKLCEKYGCAKSSLYRALKKENMKLPKRQIESHYYDEERLYEIELLYENGYSINQISKTLHMGERTISLYLDKIGIRKRRVVESKELECDHDYFQYIDNSEKAYWLGFIMADGCVRTDKGYRLSLELANKDKTQLELFKQCIRSNHEITHRSNRDTCCISLNSQLMVSHLIDLGCVPRKTYNGFINFSLLDEQYYSDFMRGFTDGDGYIEKNKSKYRIVLTLRAPQLIDDITYILDSIKIHSRVDTLKTYSRIVIERKEDFFKTLEWMYFSSDIYLNRKYGICKERLK